MDSQSFWKLPPLTAAHCGVKFSIEATTADSPPGSLVRTSSVRRGDNPHVEASYSLTPGVTQCSSSPVTCSALRFLPPCCCLHFSPRPAPAADDDVIDKMTSAKIERIMNSFNDVKNFKELDDGTYSFENDGLKVIIFNKGATMQLYAGFRGKATLSRINEWNRSKRFCRAYTNTKGEPVLESDIELTGGVTERNVKEWMKTYIVCLKAFKKHIEE